MTLATAFARTLALGAALTLVACGGATPPPAATPPSAATPSILQKTWSHDLSDAEKLAFMKTRVMPAMREAFQGHDATRYAGFSCATCHGPEGKEPYQYLPHLTMRKGKLTAFAEKPAVSRFMAEVVTPKMAAAMGRPLYDPATLLGFGCAGCHAVDKL